MAKSVSIEGKHLRWFVLGALALYWGELHRTRAELDPNFDQFLSDTCNRLHRFLTGGARVQAGCGLDGTAADIQCSIALEARGAFGVEPGDLVTIYW